MIERRSFPSASDRARLWVLVVVVHVIVRSSLKADTFVDSRYQYYQEDHNRIRVDSDYSLFGIDLNDTLKVDGSLLYSAISGASPTGLPPPLATSVAPKVTSGQVPIVTIHDERWAFTLGVTKQIGNHSIRGSFAYSTESDYISRGYALQDTISFNQKNTDLVLGLAYDDDTVGANGSTLSALKQTYDAIVGINQVLSPNDLLSVNVSVGWRDGYLNDPYKVALLNSFYVVKDTRPSRRFEQLVFLQWTHFIEPLGASLETSYRYGHNDWGSDSHTGTVSIYKKFLKDSLTVGPTFRYYRQSAADFYATQFTGNPKYYSSDYRLSAEETYSIGVQMRWFPVKDRFAVDLGYERYTTRGLDHVTAQSAYPDANSVTVGLHFQF